MQVTAVAEHITHAVINAGETMDFGVSDDPMFFQMLSSTLYTRQEEAMVRETICNAWDAHIDAGVTDPIQITLDSDFLTIRDFGKGIPHDKIRPIYLIYGKSTKTNVSNQTGGFGLGCKAPFAYTDHFEVRSYHQGICTIYNMSKASIEHDGKPAASVVVSLPTTETGLQVRIPVRDKGSLEERRKLSEMIRRLVWLGGIKAVFHHVNLTEKPEELPVVQLDNTPGSFMISCEAYRNTFTGDRLYVRYGSVVYPIPQSEEYHTLWSEAQDVVRKVAGASNAAAIFQAGPDSICIPPSREQLAIMPLTVATVSGLLEGFISGFEDAYNNRAKGLVVERFKAIVDDPNESGLKLFSDQIKTYLGTDVDSSWDRSLDPKTVISDHATMVNEALSRKLPSSNHFLEFVHKERLDAMVAKKLILPHQAADFVKHFGINSITNGYNDATPFMFTEIWKSLINKITRSDDLDIKRLCVHQVKQYSSTTHIVPIKDTDDIGTTTALLYMRNILVLSYNKSAITEGDYEAQASWERYGKLAHNHLVYIVPANKEQADKTREFFKNLRGYIVIDLTQEQDKERQAAAAARRKASAGKPTTKKKEGYLAATSAYYRKDGDKWDVDYLDFQNAMRDDRILTPKWAEKRPTITSIRASRNSTVRQLNEHLTNAETVKLMAPFASVGALWTTPSQAEKLEPLPRLIDYAAEKYIQYMEESKDRLIAKQAFLWATVQNDPVLKKFMAKHATGNIQLRKWYDLLLSNQELSRYFGLQQKVDRHRVYDSQMHDVGHVVVNNSRLLKDKDSVMDRIDKLQRQINSPSAHPNVRAVLMRLRECPVLHLLDFEHIRDDVEGKPAVAKATIAFLIKTLNTYRGKK